MRTLLSYRYLLLCTVSLLAVAAWPISAATAHADRNTALLAAIQKDDRATVLALLKKGANSNARNKDGVTALMLAASRGYADLVALLLDRGADLRASDREGNSVLRYADAPAILHLLHRRGADINARNKDGETLLILAARGGWNAPQYVKALLTEGADPNLRDKHGVTAIIRTAWWTQYDLVLGGEEQRHADVVHLLAAAGANLNAQDRDGVTALMRAAGWRHPKTVQALLDCGARIDIKDRRGRTVLTWAARNGQKDACVQGLLKKGARVSLLEAILMEDHPAARAAIAGDADLYACGPYGETALSAAAEKGYADIVHALLARGADPNAREDPMDIWGQRRANTRLPVGKTALMLAIAGRPQLSQGGGEVVTGDPKDPARLEIIKTLLAAGANVNATDEKGRTTLLWAVPISPLEVIQALLNAGADPNIRAEMNYVLGDTALMAAASAKRPEVVRALLEKGAEVNRSDQERRGTPLLYSIKEHNLETVKILLEHGADVNVRDWRQETALMIAAQDGNSDLVPLLLERGAAINAANKDGETALMAAASGDHPDIAQFLLDKGANAQARDRQGNTALTYAAERGKTDPISVLLLKRGVRVGLLDAVFFGDAATVQSHLAAGANPNSQTTWQKTALMIAAAKADVGIVKALLEKGAKVNARDYMNRTPLMWAVGQDKDFGEDFAAVNRLGQPGVEERVLATIRMLLARGTAINVRTNDYEYGMTALMIAVSRTNRAVVKLLLDKGADVRVNNDHGKAVLDLAKEAKHSDIVTLLKQAGAKEEEDE